MVDDEWDDDPPAPRLSLRSFLIRDWPYIAMLVLGVFGVALTSYARSAVTTFWIILCPVFGIICVAAGWREVKGREAQWQLIRQQTLHWLAVMFAIYLVFVAVVKQMMNEDASALMVLTLLALGTFTAGNYAGGWRVCLVGIVLALGVPAVAWLEHSGAQPSADTCADEEPLAVGKPAQMHSPCRADFPEFVVSQSG